MPNSTSQQAFFTKVPNSLFDYDISPSAFKLWCYLRSNKPGYNPTAEMIHEKTKIKNWRSIKKAMNELVSLKLLVVSLCPGKRRCLAVLDPVESTHSVESTPSVESTYPPSVESTYPPSVESTYPPSVESAEGLLYRNKTNNNINNKTRHKNKPSPPPKKSDVSKKPTPKYTDEDRHAANQWHEYLKEHHPHHEKNIKILSTASAIATLRAKEGISYTELLKWQQLCSEDEFWRSNLISLAGLIKKRWKNKTRAIDNLKEAADKRYKRKEELQQQDAFMNGNIIDMESTGVVTI